MAQVKAIDVEIALGERCRRDGNGYWPQIEVRDPTGLLRLDGVALQWSFSRMWISGYEIKVSRSDFLRDAKYTLYRNHVDDMTLVCPARMIDRDEVPEPIGLMWYYPDTAAGNPKLRWRRRPEPSHGDTRQVEHQLLNRLTRDGGRAPAGRYGRYESARVYLEERDTMRNVGRALGTRMAMRLQALEAMQEPTHRRQVEARSAAFERLVQILNGHGYDQISRWCPVAELDARLEDLDKAMASTAPLDEIDRETRYMIREIDGLRTRLGLDGEGDGR